MSILRFALVIWGALMCLTAGLIWIFFPHDSDVISATITLSALGIIVATVNIVIAVIASLADRCVNGEFQRKK